MLYEDDFEFEEQPANIRDRNVPGRGGDRGGPRRGGGRGEGRRSYGEGRRHVAFDAGKPQPLPEDAKPAHDLLKELLERMGVQAVEIAYVPRSEGEYFEISGPDLAALIGRHGSTLEAVNLIFNNIINAGSRTNRRYYTIDAEGYRAKRADDLKELALETLERVVSGKKPVKLEPMLPSERKIVHLAIADDARVRTESEGVEPERRVVIFPV